MRLHINCWIIWPSKILRWWEDLAVQSMRQQLLLLLLLFFFLLLLLLLFNFKIVQPIDFRAGQNRSSVLHRGCSYGRCDYILSQLFSILMVTENLGLNFDLGKINLLLWLPFDRELQQQPGNEYRNKIIPDESITSSSYLSSDRASSYARLDGPRAWCSAPGDNSSYIQILLEEETLITAIETQGSRYDSIWSRRYDVWYLKRGKWILHRKVL